ncbi:hypothetical protein BLNAU_7203 [Blattamonas nauphoetae]|uniref:Uncharacterized protein n=1 Tax=Blattamonas nauphoetae TaxID=2049346 RepID=A0ABQ9Y242_9EUKA|nr:hypothetical protein BLNAU_7203 [Blattamonas nauphoetae]
MRWAFLACEDKRENFQPSRSISPHSFTPTFCAVNDGMQADGCDFIIDFAGNGHDREKKQSVGRRAVGPTAAHAYDDSDK